jgi:Superinfection immunity protein
MDDAEDIIRGLFVLALLFSIYLFPYIIARGRHLTNRWSIFFLNLFLGWTLAGWVGALCWAASSPPLHRTHRHGGASDHPLGDQHTIDRCDAPNHPGTQREWGDARHH